MESGARIPPPCPPRPREPAARPEDINTTQPSNRPHKAPPPPKPRPYSPASATSPSPESPPRSPPLQNGAPPSHPARKSVRSGPPPIPSRVDLGEGKPERTVTSVQEDQRRQNDSFLNKGSPKLKAKGRPEITIVSARPMSSNEGIPAPVIPPSIPPSSPPNNHSAPQRPTRKAKGREPPPRPKSRPVSELDLGLDTRESASAMSTEKGGKPETNKEMQQRFGMSDGSVASACKKPDRPSKPVVEDNSMENASAVWNVDRTLELIERTDGRPKEGSIDFNQSEVKPSTVNGNSKESAKNEKGFDTQKADSNETATESKNDEEVPKKKSKPTVIIPRPSRKTEPAKDIDHMKESEQEKDAIEMTPKSSPEVGVASRGVKRPPPAKKPKPPTTVKPYLRSKPFSKVDTPTEEVTREKESLSAGDNDNVPAPKPKVRPTVIVAKPPKTAEMTKASDSESTASKKDLQELEIKPATPGESETVEQRCQEGKPTESPTVKPKRAPTIIRAPRHEAADSETDVQIAGVTKKQPKRPSRGPSMKRPPPPRPASGPVDRAGEPEIQPSGRPESEPVPERTPDKKTKPPRPVSSPAFKDAETLKDAQKVIKSPTSDEESPALARKGSRKKPPPPRSPSVDHSTEEVAPATRGNVQSPDASPKAKKGPRPPRPSSSVLDGKRVKEDNNSTDKGDAIAPSKSKPARPQSVEAGEAKDTDVVQQVNQKQINKPERPPSMVTKEPAASTPEVVHEDKSSKPIRPPSTSFSAKNKPHRPSAPSAKSNKEANKNSGSTNKDTNETSRSTQVSSVCETYIEPSAVALYDYEPTSVEDLSFNAGDEITLVKRVDEEWYVGRLGSREGMFPVQFVEIIEDLPHETGNQTQEAKSKSSPFEVTALYDFHGNEQDGELVFTAGEVIYVTGKINQDWLKGESRGKKGAFPCNFVDATSELLEKLPLTSADSSSAKNAEENSTDSRNDVMANSRCKALFDYRSDVSDDLSFNAGDVIKLKSKISNEWLKGELHGREGMFPVSYVEIIEDLKNEGRSSQQGKDIIYGVALYEFTGTSADELSFVKGDRIQVTETVNDEWLRGKMNGREGMFPKAFVELTEEHTTSFRDTSGTVTPKAKALYDFDGETNDELSFKVGDFIWLLERVNDDWMEGELDNSVGRFPTAFVEIVVPLP